MERRDHLVKQLFELCGRAHVALQDLARTGALTDLTALWDEAEKKGWVNPGLRDQFTYRSKVYGLPLSQSYWVVYCNRQGGARRTRLIDIPPARAALKLK
jgi:maltose-binding protein MalE